MTNIRFSTFLFSLLFAALLTLHQPTFGQTPQGLSVKTDSELFTTGDTITISGNAGSNDAGPLAEIVIWNPEGALYRSSKVQVAPDGSFVYETIAGGRQGVNGTYQVVLLYNRQQTSTAFNFASSGTRLEVIVDDKSYYVLAHSASDRTSWLGITAHPESKSLAIRVDTAGPDTLKLELDKSLIDTNSNCFVVHVDNQIVDARCAGIDEQTRLLSLRVPAGADELGITGSFLVPEFTPLNMLILLAGAFGSIMIGNRVLQFRNNRCSQGQPA